MAWSLRSADPTAADVIDIDSHSEHDTEVHSPVDAAGPAEARPGARDADEIEGVPDAEDPAEVLGRREDGARPPAAGAAAGAAPGGPPLTDPGAGSAGPHAGSERPAEGPELASACSAAGIFSRMALGLATGDAPEPPDTPRASRSAAAASSSKLSRRAPSEGGAEAVGGARGPKRACRDERGGGGALGAAASGGGAAAPRWARPPPPPSSLSALQPLSFLLVATDERAEAPPAGFAAARGEPGPVLHFHGVTREGCSVLLHVHGFLPYFFALRPEEAGVGLEGCRRALDGLQADGRVVAALEEAERMPLMHYQEQPLRLLRITVARQKLIATCRGELEKGLRVGGAVWRSPAYEANVSLEMRLLVDKGIAGGAWVEVPEGRYRLRARGDRTSTAQLEADAHWEALVGQKAEGRWLGLAPLRLLALHLRTVGPEARVVAGAAVLQVHGEAAPRHVAAWVVDPGAGSRAPEPMGGAELFTFTSEAACLTHIRDYVVESDADVLVGYDLLRAHLTAAIGRAEASKLPGGRPFTLGRLTGVASRARNSTFETRQLGKHETKDVNVEGRLLVDLLTLLEREQKLTSYSLSAVALHFLDETRLELRAARAERLGREEPVRLAALALRDAELCLRLFGKLQVLFRYVEMARVTGVPMDSLLVRGQSVKVFSMLLRKAREHGYVLPPPARGGGAEESYEGGAVLEPLAGYYDEAVVTLDFASLYPSIMQRHNLCYSTLLPPGAPAPGASLPEGEAGCEEVPGLGHRFVTARVRRGLVPMVLEELLAARAAAKREMKMAQDPQARAVLDGRQLALKVSANSVYGFTGMSVGTLPCQAIAASVTAYGRRMIERTRRVIEERFCRDQGCEEDARVIYGDTDSVMVTLGPECTMRRAFDFGKQAAELVSREFGAPVRMEFEKVYQPYLLMSKKRYAGLAWPTPGAPGQLDVKGLEVVRRDWCQLVRQVVQRSLQLLLRERAPERAVAHVQEAVALLRGGRVDPRLLAISKALVRDGAEAYTAKQAHVELAEKLRQRDPASAPQVGERVAYVVVAAAAGTPAYERAEDPAYAVERELPIDADHYVEHQLKQPLLRIFEPVLGAGSAPPVEQRLFGGDGARRTARAAQGGGGGPLSAFARARQKCLHCRAVLQGGGALCPRCRGDGRAGEVLLAQVAGLRALEEETSQLLSQCMRCEGPGAGDLHLACMNADCPIFFRRLQVTQKLAVAEDSLRKLNLDW